MSLLRTFDSRYVNKATGVDGGLSNLMLASKNCYIDDLYKLTWCKYTLNSKEKTSRLATPENSGYIISTLHSATASKARK